ncbi:MAG TPA: tetrathionate reductase family octaheme c-type cytochrome [Bacteroides sp.]|nr:tetrathionate reductase family octaheme c-type cytochrome [Bacteroides sp.]
MKILLIAVFVLFLGVLLYNPEDHAEFVKHRAEDQQVQDEYQQEQTDSQPDLAHFQQNLAGIRVDHTPYIDGPFSTPQEVTETCLICHEEMDLDILKTRHWNWLGEEFVEDGESMKLGKQNIINNFCIAVPSNWPRCTSCHIGYGWKDETFDFTDGYNIDCLICHDRTGTYQKTPTGAGMPDPSVDLVKVARGVGKTTIHNCSICHFNGGGGTGVKHGDMDESMINPTPEIDVHMGANGFTCASCHAGENHQILGASHGSMEAGTNHISCVDCHGDQPHSRKIVNNHNKSVACETCHIPSFAREEPTKTWWDWSTAGNKKRTVQPDEFGKADYDVMKGDFAWEKDVVPEYLWYNGEADYYHIGDQLDPGEPLKMNILQGNIEDETAKIYPFKVMRGKQIYDTRNRYLIVPKVYGEGGYWQTYDWNTASELGMKEINLPYSGRYGFVETEMTWPINHMVAPVNKTLNCRSCHVIGQSGRLNWEALGYAGDPMRTGSRFR